MAIQKIIVPFLTEEAGRPAFEASAVIASRFKAHLDVVHMRQRITPALPGNIYYPIAITYVEENIEALRDAADMQADAQKKLFAQLCSEHDISIFDEAEHTADKGATAAWADIDAVMPYDLASRARISDLAVLAKSGKDAPAFEFDLIEELVFHSGRPVLLVDSENPFREFPETVVVAWNGGREAARAVASALPILKQAKLVIVMSIGEKPCAIEPPDNVSAYLRLHGVRATHLKVHTAKGVEAEEEFMAQVNKKNADLIVMGAYSHTRWREVILGGFTRHLLRRSETALLLSH